MYVRPDTELFRGSLGGIIVPEGVLEEVLQSEFDLEVGLQTAPGFAIDLPEYFELV